MYVLYRSWTPLSYNPLYDHPGDTRCTVSALVGLWESHTVSLALMSPGLCLDFLLFLLCRAAAWAHSLDLALEGKFLIHASLLLIFILPFPGLLGCLPRTPERQNKTSNRVIFFAARNFHHPLNHPS